MSTDKKIESIPLSKGQKCPTCQKPASLKHRPFCSKRCADLDLGQWLNEGYKIASEEESDMDEYDPG
ncbi:DNA gyrase inhibitor YacG [Candidatus Terasakiella magnetica]|uniref:DNA gyrase inhibitor YacG n=1 Tax=Candidatus Terasakiella magnetica TaxID=1867952 RepID=UPI000840C356|nr:DNA gyrase inhibitor YacG [Candidatus Terasakiella magnetica]